MSSKSERILSRRVLIGTALGIAGLAVSSRLVFPERAAAVPSVNRFGVDVYGDGTPITDITTIVSQLNTEKSNRQALYSSYQTNNTYNPVWVMTQATYNSFANLSGNTSNVSFEQYLRDTLDPSMRDRFKNAGLLPAGTDTSSSGPKTGFDSRVILIVDPTIIGTFKDANASAQADSMNGMTSFDGFLIVGGSERAAPTSFDATLQQNLEEYAFHGATRLPEATVGDVSSVNGDLSANFQTLLGSNVLKKGVQLKNRPYNANSLLAGTGTEISSLDALMLEDRGTRSHIYSEVTPQSFYLPYRVPGFISLGFTDQTGTNDISGTVNYSTLEIYWSQKTGVGTNKTMDTSGLRTLTTNTVINPDEIFTNVVTINGKKYIDPRETVGYVRINKGTVNERWGILTYESIMNGFLSNIDRTNNTMPPQVKITIPTFGSETPLATTLNTQQQTDSYTIVGAPVSLPTPTPVDTTTPTVTVTRTATSTDTATASPTSTDTDTPTRTPIPAPPPPAPTTPPISGPVGGGSGGGGQPPASTPIPADTPNTAVTPEVTAERSATAKVTQTPTITRTPTGPEKTGTAAPTVKPGRQFFPVVNQVAAPTTVPTQTPTITPSVTLTPPVTHPLRNN